MTTERRVRIVVVNLGLNNLKSLTSAMSCLSFLSEVVVVESGEFIDDLSDIAQTVVFLPGTGHFGAASSTLKARGLDRALTRWVERGGALVGICLGMQLMAVSSEEAPGESGLGFFPSTCLKFDESLGSVPNIGWLGLQESPTQGGLTLADSSDVYFVHSFFLPVVEGFTTSTSEHNGQIYSAAMQAGRVFGMQFHPEKSSQFGLRLLEQVIREI